MNVDCIEDNQDVLNELRENGFVKIKQFFRNDEIKIFLDEFWLQMSVYGVDPEKPETIEKNWLKDPDGNNDSDIAGRYGFMKM